MKRIWFGLILLVAVLAGLVSVGATASAESALRPGYAGDIVYVVRWGDTVSAIADRYGTSPVLIINANKLRNPNVLVVGARLVIPVKGYVSPGWTAPVPVANVQPHATPPAPAPGDCIPYTTQPGDSTSSIAAKFGVSVESLIQVNNLINPSYIHAGVTIRVCDVAYTPPAQVVWQPAPQVVVQPVVVVAPPPGPPPVCLNNYVVRHGDSLVTIATWSGANMVHLRQMNNMANDNVWVGMVLRVPCGNGPPPPPPPKPEPVAYHHPNIQPAVCNPGVAVTFPRSHEYVHGIIDIVGTATINNFQFYKVEYGQGTVPFNFSSIGDVVSSQKTGTTLVTWDTTTVPNGEYTLRLTAVDKQGQFPQPCNVYIVVDN